MKKRIGKLLRSLQKAPERKHYLEFVTAALSIPVLFTVILVNLNNLKSNNATPKTTPAPTSPPREIIIHESTAPQSITQNPSPTSSSCKKQIGPVSISYPAEGSTITDNPVNFIINYDNSTYCSVVWSYRINGGSWSEYSPNSPSIFNLPNGAVTFDLRIQSTVSQDQNQITRKFNYQGGQSAPTPTVSPTSSPTPTP